MKDQKCLNCKFYAGGSNDEGICVRYPPTVILDPSDTNLLTVFPNVDGENMWCGEYTENDED